MILPYYWADAVKWHFTNSFVNRLNAFHYALFSDDPGDDGVIRNEISASGYSRLPVLVSYTINEALPSVTLKFGSATWLNNGQTSWPAIKFLGIIGKHISYSDYFYVVAKIPVNNIVLQPNATLYVVGVNYVFSPSYS